MGWVDEETGRSYDSGYYDENGQYYANISFEKNGRYENVVCHCPYCGQNTILNLSVKEASGTMQCPNCGGPMELRSELETVQNAVSYTMPGVQGRKKRKLWIIPLVIVLAFVGLVAFGMHILKQEEQQAEEFRIYDTDDSDAACDSVAVDFGETVGLRKTGDNAYTLSDGTADKQLVWDDDAESYYDETSDCWLWYNTDVEPPVWQYWYEGISSDFGEYGWMEHDEDGWFIEESYGKWIALPEQYDADMLWYID